MPTCSLMGEGGSARQVAPVEFEGGGGGGGGAGVAGMVGGAGMNSGDSGWVLGEGGGGGEEGDHWVGAALKYSVWFVGWTEKLRAGGVWLYDVTSGLVYDC